ncbi:hypothetical protein [Chroococcus sp. FPU101]|uniref:hypothetical protein n=1 Tax=Chroococcus sp. FPU101 TaxID=1974212 RepID=UPI001A9063D1|nr:hypothetical protein [Chroococcus sp. FPU101]
MFKSRKIPVILILILLIGTALATSQYFEFGMMGLTGFVLAYLGKGIRKVKPRTPN